MSITTITSETDERLRPYRELKDVAQRVAGCFIAESELVVTRVLDSSWSIESLLITANRFRRLEERLARRPDVDVLVVEPDVLDAVVGFPMHRGVLGLVHRPRLPTVDELLADARRVVVLEDVVDPDNVGAIFRHAAAFAADAVVLSAHAGDPLYRKAVRTSMGWALSVPYARVDERDDLLDVLSRNGIRSVAFTPGAPASLREVAAAVSGERVAVLVGAEAPGLRDQTIAGADFSARIPIDPAIDSLNVATAAAIGLYELFGSRLA